MLRARNVIAAAVLSGLLFFIGHPFAQGQPPSTQPPPPDEFRLTHPRVKLIYYAGREGNVWKEVQYFDLDEWAPGTDVIIRAEWAECEGQTAPGARAPREKRRHPWRHRTWKVEYVGALDEGEPRLFVGGAGLQRRGVRIYGADDFVALHYIPYQGWYVLGQAARLYRHRDAIEYQPPLGVQGN